jgi:DNA-binding transcriptional regulator YhcF (GntR family)
MNAVQLKKEPLYMQLKQKLINLISTEDLTMLPQERAMVKLYGVSRITVRKAVMELTKEGIVSPVQGRGTMVTKNAPLSHKELGVIAGSNSWYVENLFSAAMEESKKLKYNINTIVLNKHNNNVALPSSNSLFSLLIATRKLNGLLLTGKLPGPSMEHLIKKKVPMAVFGIKLKKYDLPCVRLEFERPVEKMTEKLIAADFKRIAFIAISPKTEKEDDAIGDHYYFKKSYNHIIKKYNLPKYNFPERGKDTVESTMNKFYSLPPQKRPNVFVVRFYGNSMSVKDFLADKKDWNPLLVACHEESDGLIKNNYREMIKLSLQSLVEIIENPGKKIKDKTLPIEIILNDNALKNKKRNFK